MAETGSTDFWEWLRAAASGFGRWVREHEQEIMAMGLWVRASSVCERTNLYAPADHDAWDALDAAFCDTSNTPQDLTAITLELYGPGGLGFDALCSEIKGAPLLQDRTDEVEQVLEALADGKYYLAICGALPLVEFVLSKAAGKWRQPYKQPIGKRLTPAAASELTEEDQVHLILNEAAVNMLQHDVSTMWKSGKHHVGAAMADLNRHKALHGTALGWESKENATQTALLLAAACQVADPLLAPRRAQVAAAP